VRHFAELLERHACFSLGAPAVGAGVPNTYSAAGLTHQHDVPHGVAPPTCPTLCSRRHDFWHLHTVRVSAVTTRRRRALRKSAALPAYRRP
jgi:hypothetical protein